MSKKVKYITLSQFGKLVGISRQRVNVLANKGKISIEVIDGIKKVNPTIAKKEYKANQDSTAAKKNPSGKKKPTKKVTKEITKKDIEKLKPKMYEGMTTADAERQDKVWKARLSQLKFMEQSGELIDASKVKIQAFEMGRKVRDAILSVAPRLSHELAAETDPHQLEIKLTKELNSALEKIIGVKK